MRYDKWLFVSAVVAGLGAAVASSAVERQHVAQAAPDRSVMRQRAPGVPMAPQAGDFDRMPSENGRANALPDRPQGEQHARNAPQPDRDPPMPRPVPSIIAP